jgi:two-component system phosphate regulon sensor histidine kinase PhoR
VNWEVAGFVRVRRLLLVNALIFAILAAAVALAYYGYSAAAGVSSRERELQLMHDLAEEKVVSLEALIVRNDIAVFSDVQLDDMSRLQAPSLPASIGRVMVLDDKLELVPDGYVARRADTDKERKVALEFRDRFMREILPDLPLQKQAERVRGHVYRVWDKTRLFSFTKKKDAGDRIYYVIVEDDYNYFQAWLFPQFFGETSKRLYQVIDERGVVYGSPFIETGGLTVEVPFQETGSWILRVAEKDLDVQHALERRRVFDSLMIGGAVAVILVGLAFLALAIRRERRANELKSDFISNVSHELKTPLSIISMFGEMLANGRTKGPEQATEYAEIIWRESVRLGRLIDNVLDFAKIERGMGVYEFADADIGEVTTRAIELVGRRLTAAEMTLDANIAPELPLVRLDVNAFTLAVMNLIDNAIKYAAEGKKIEVRVAQEGERIVLSVRDWGQGIDPEEHEPIFERFYRARAVRLKPIRGSGIGLALVRHIAKAHGGDVSVESEPGKGATFRLWVPV